MELGSLASVVKKTCYNASANLICTFVMPAIRLIDIRRGSRNSRYAIWAEYQPQALHVRNQDPWRRR